MRLLSIMAEVDMKTLQSLSMRILAAREVYQNGFAGLRRAYGS